MRGWFSFSSPSQRGRGTAKRWRGRPAQQRSGPERPHPHGALRRATSPASQGRKSVALLAALVLAGCQTMEKPLQDTALHVAFEHDARRDGFRRVAVVTEDYYYCYPLTRQVFRVPRGFETDFASIPVWASAVFNPIGDDAEAAVVHDWLYAVGEPGGREEADAIFLYALQQSRVPALERKLMYEAVRAGGAGSYGAPGEWRFVDPETEKPVKPPKKPPTAVVATLKSCDDLKTSLPRLRLLAAARLQ